MNKELTKTLAEKKLQHEAAVRDLSNTIKNMQSEMNEATSKLKSKEDEIQSLNIHSERAKILQLEVQGLQNGINIMQREYDEVVDEFDIIS